LSVILFNNHVLFFFFVLLFLNTDLKTLFSKAFTISNSNPAMPVDGVAGQQEEAEDVGIELVLVSIQEVEYKKSSFSEVF
jgi:hypothetical protein